MKIRKDKASLLVASAFIKGKRLVDKLTGANRMTDSPKAAPGRIYSFTMKTIDGKVSELLAAK